MSDTSAYPLCGNRDSIRSDLPCILEQGHAFPHTNKNGGFWRYDGDGERLTAPNLSLTGTRKLYPHDVQRCKHPDCHDEWMRMNARERKRLKEALL
jgi:hypothetical protein